MTEQILFSGVTPNQLSELIVKGLKEVLSDFEKSNQKSIIEEVDENLTIKEACSFLKCSTVKLWRLRKSGELPYKKCGRNILFKKSDLEKVLKSEVKEGGYKND